MRWYRPKNFYLTEADKLLLAITGSKYHVHYCHTCERNYKCTANNPTRNHKDMNSDCWPCRMAGNDSSS